MHGMEGTREKGKRGEDLLLPCLANFRKKKGEKRVCSSTGGNASGKKGGKDGGNRQGKVRATYYIAGIKKQHWGESPRSFP